MDQTSQGDIFNPLDLSQRKEDHITLALKSQAQETEGDPRFYYEPLGAAHPVEKARGNSLFSFHGKNLGAPLWISSMTGGAQHAREINRNLALAAKEFRLGMGLGSCRPLLEDNDCLEDFNLRKILGPDLPFFANLGIAQIEKSIAHNQLYKIEEMLKRLEVDGLIIHVNPLQEWFQPEGDRLLETPLTTIERTLENLNVPIIVKEVGQGIGPSGITSLLKLPLAAIEFGAYGGTNFSLVEQHRQSSSEISPLSFVGHSANQMAKMISQILSNDRFPLRCQSLIISGGIRSALDGYYLISQSPLPSLYGLASRVLPYAQKGVATLLEFIEKEIALYSMAQAYLVPRPISEMS